MSKKVLMIDGSARKKNTYNMLLQIEKILKQKGIEVEILHLFDYELKDCVGCELCVTHKACGLKDDMPVILQKIMDSDGVVLSSPVYMGGATSKFKTFADRTNIWVHKPETAGKPVLFVTATMSTGIKEIKRFFQAFATGFGARKGDFIARTGKNLSKPVQEKELSKFLTLLTQEKQYYRPAMNEIVMFNVGKVLALKSNGDDNRFWEEKKWFTQQYYYACKINPFKKLFSKFMFKVLSKAMQ